VTFSVKAAPGAEVWLAGTFNNWQVGERRLVDKSGAGDYTVSLMLAPGEHQYKFVINGVWTLDPANGDWVANDVGSLNSVRRVT